MTSHTGRQLLMAGLFLAIAGCSVSTKQPVSDHYDGTRFYLKGNDHSFSDMLKWLWQMETVSWPDWVNDPPQPQPVPVVSDNQLKVTYINHATVLIQIDGLNILTDPIWSVRAGPFNWLGAKRVRSPGVAFDKLPAIDLVLLSHDHYDHLDIPTMGQLISRDNPVILGGLKLGRYFPGSTSITELDWWQKYSLPDSSIAITFVPAMHSSGRLPFLSNRTLWGGYILHHPAGNIYFTGDTGFSDFIRQIAEISQPVRLAILPVGSYEKRWFMKNQHMNPDDAVKAHTILNAGQSMGIHYGTFAEHPEQEINAHEHDLATALQKYSVTPSSFWLLGFGEGRFVKGITTN